jgi:hypothetical protein
MKKSLKWVPTLLASITLMTFLASCGGDSKTEKSPEKSPTAKTEKSESPKSESQGLTIEKVVLGKKNKATDKIDPVASGTFKKNDVVALVLINVGKFKKGDDGKHKFDMDMEIQDGKGKLLGKKEGLLGTGGNIVLPKDIAESPYGSIDTAVTKLESGEYTIKLTIYDKIGTGRATESKTFKLE